METQETKIVEGKKFQSPPRRGGIKAKPFGERAEKAMDAVGMGRENKSEGKISARQEMETQETKIVGGKKFQVPRRAQIKENIFAESTEAGMDAFGMVRENKSEGKSKGGGESGSPASITHPSEGKKSFLQRAPSLRDL